MANLESHFILSDGRSESRSGVSSEDSSIFSSLNTGTVWESYYVDEDKEFASKAVTYVLRGTRKGIVPLCSDVAQLLKSKRRLEHMVQAQQMEISRLQRAASVISNLPTRHTSPSPRPSVGNSHPSSAPKPAYMQTIVAICHRDRSEDSPPPSPRSESTECSQGRQILQVKPVSAHGAPRPQSMDAASISQEPVPVSTEPASEKLMPRPPEPTSTVVRPIPLSGNTVDVIEFASFSLESAPVSTEPVPARPIYDSMGPVPVSVKPVSVIPQTPPAEDKKEKSRTIISREVQVECPHILMCKKYDDQLIETLVLNSRLNEDLRKAWKQIEALRNRLRDTEEHWRQQWQAQTERINYSLLQSGSDSQDLLSLHRECRNSATQTIPSTVDPSPSDICVALGDLESLDLSSQPLEEEPPGPCHPEHKLKSLNADFLTDAKVGSTLFFFPMIGCKCTSCLSFFYDHSHNGRSKTNKDFKALQRLRSQKVQVNLQDYVIMSGNRSGTVHYIGHLDNSGAAGAVFLGLELDEPSGTHNGVFKGKRYYQCFKDCGLFIPIHKVYYRIRNKVTI